MNRSAKKPAPPVPQSSKPHERISSVNDNKYSSDSSEAEIPTTKESSVATNLDSNYEKNLIANIESNPSTTDSPVIYSTASLDRPAKKPLESHSERPMASDRKGANIQLRSKVIEKPNVPPPSVPNRNSTIDRPQSVYERPTIPPPERPQRSCDNKMKDRSLEFINDSNIIEEKSCENESNSKSLYPSLNEFNCFDVSNESSNESNDNSSVDSLKTKTLNSNNDCIAFADDSDVEDNNNVSNNKHKIDSNYVQKLKQSIPNQTIPTKPPRAQSPANLIDKRESDLTFDESIKSDIQSDIDSNAKSSQSNHSIESSGLSVTAQPQPQSRPPRPLPPNKPRIAASSENTYL